MCLCFLVPKGLCSLWNQTLVKFKQTSTTKTAQNLFTIHIVAELGPCLLDHKHSLCVNLLFGFNNDKLLVRTSEKWSSLWNRVFLSFQVQEECFHLKHVLNIIAHSHYLLHNSKRMMIFGVNSIIYFWIQWSWGRNSYSLYARNLKIYY